VIVFCEIVLASAAAIILALAILNGAAIVQSISPQVSSKHRGVTVKAVVPKMWICCLIASPDGKLEEVGHSSGTPAPVGGQKANNAPPKASRRPFTYMIVACVSEKGKLDASNGSMRLAQARNLALTQKNVILGFPTVTLALSA